MNKILVVDDDLDILSLVKIMLTMNQFNVEAISRWEEIDTCMHHFKPDLVLLDVSLGDADGRDICKQMRTAKETAEVPVILFSANAEMGKYIGDCHAQAFIPKPFELSKLINTIKTHLN
jgi:DNA-binding response OmpR family regulator